MDNTQDLRGRRAVVTGGMSGLGRAIAATLADAGADIVVVDLPDTIAAAELPPGWQSAGLDLAADDALTKLRQLGDDIGSVDMVVANAGVVPPWRGVAELDAAEWRQVMAVNCWGVAATLGGLAPALERSGRGAALVMASINGYRAHPEQILYTASKHAVVGIMRAAALDLGRRKIRVNALAPGPIATDALRRRLDARHATGDPDPQTALASLAGETALGEIATEDDVARAALFLLSDSAAATTGVVLPVEAGLG